MIAAEKMLLDADSSYEIAAAIHRAKVVANRTPHPNEVLPVDGKLHVSLIGTPLPFGTEAAVFGESSIDIPEFRAEYKKNTSA
jgi:hypothetical protein